MTHAANDRERSDPTAALRQLPAVHRIIDAVLDTTDDGSRRETTTIAREVLDEARAALVGGLATDVPSLDALTTEVRRRIGQRERNRFRGAVNATGVLLHTGLGRAPLADDAVARVTEVARGYAPVELDLDSGRRGRRVDIVRDLLCQLTGAESATVVNNNAGALVLALAAVAKDREVIVSRGQLIEIGGSFRLPDIMAIGGAVLREVGTTNKTRLDDYAAAINEQSGAILRVHPSNYRVEGFTANVPIGDLVALGRRAGLPVIDDTGSGLLQPHPNPAVRDEPDATTSVAAGADLVLFSGDKLLGGPQAGLIVGSARWIDRLERHPLARALRVDKLVLAALAETLRLHRDDAASVPVHRMLDTPIDELRTRAETLRAAIGGHDGITVSIEPAEAYPGGGSMPTRAIPSVALRVDLGTITTVESFVRMLRLGATPVVARITDDAAWLDLRTVQPAEDELLIRALNDALNAVH